MTTRSSELALRLSIGAAVLVLALDGGSYSVGSRLSVAILVAWAVGIAAALGLVPGERVPRAALAALGLLACFAVWTLVSMSWAASDERAFAEFNRVSLYLVVAAATALAARRASAALWSDGLAIGLLGVCAVALASRFFLDLFGEPAIADLLGVSGRTRLSYPVNYWNGLAILCALALPLCLRLAVSARGAVAGGLAVAPLPAVAAVIYLASSRGGFLTLLVGALVFVGLADRRYTAVAALLAAGAGSAVVIASLARWDELVDEPTAAEAVGQGRAAALVVVLACLGAGTLFGFLRLLPLRPPPRPVGYALVGVALAVVVAAAVAAGPRERFETFKQRPTPGEDVREHLVSGSSTGRWQHWTATLEQFREEPLHGQGAGSYAAWWAQHGDVAGFVSEAHSLYLETLGELGLVGLALVAASFLLALGTGAARALRADGDLRASAAALTAAFAAYAVAAGFDWMWELTIVSLVGTAILGLLVGPATRGGESEGTKAGPVVRIAVPALAAAVIAAAAVSLLRDSEVRRSQDEAARGRTDAAVSAALRAHALEPWAASPPLQLALVYEAAGDISSAQRWIADAIASDPADWRIRLAAARIETRAGDADEARLQLERAVELNPRSPLFADLGGATG